MHKRQKIWNRPPCYRGPRCNRRVLKIFTDMARGLAVTANCRSVAERLTVIRSKLEYRINDRGVNDADVSAYIAAVFGAFLALRDGMELDEAEIEEALSSLEGEINALTALIREGAVSPWEGGQTNRHLGKLAANTQKISGILRYTRNDLRRNRKKLNQVSARLAAEREGIERERLEMQKRRLETYCSSREKALSFLEAIRDELSEIAALARVTPALARRANRKMRIKRLSDFYLHPRRAQAEREKLAAELLFIIREVDESYALNNDLGSLVYGNEEHYGAVQPKEREAGRQSQDNAEKDYRLKTAQSVTYHRPSGAN